MARHRLFRRRTFWDRVRENMHIIVTAFALVATVFGWSAISNTEQPLASTEQTVASTDQTSTATDAVTTPSEPASHQSADIAPPALSDDPLPVAEPVIAAVASAEAALPQPAVATVAIPEPAVSAPIMAAPVVPAPVVPAPLPRTKPVAPQKLQAVTTTEAPQRIERAPRAAEPGKVRTRQARTTRFAQARQAQVTRHQVRRQSVTRKPARRVERVAEPASDGSYVDPFDCKVKKQHPCFSQ